MTVSNFTSTLLLFAVVLVVLPSGAYAFGAGDIPDFAYLNDKAFRHGDIENILSELVKSYGHASGGGSGLLEFASSLISQATGGSKFSKDDVKRVYFGNWLRDYSQAMDIAGLSKLTGETIVLIVSVLGFLTFGFATEEFEVTAERLGVYLPVEHIDNPKGYAEKEGDARQFHPKLRPPVRAEELEIDQRTGMKNYMATENRGWDTSTAHIRRVFRACIDHGRRSRGREGNDLFEAFRLLGTGLHTMEDLLAHSNWCEIALRKMGHQEVFCHVGDRVVVNTPNGPAPPLVTGTFGSADFMHSMMGEATDHLSQASVVDLSAKMSAASSGDNNAFVDLKNLLSKVSLGGGDDELNQMNQMHEESKAYDFNPNDIASPEVQKKLLSLLEMRDNIYRQILQKIEQIPGLSDLLEALTNALNAYIYTILAPYLTPILQQVSGVLSEGSQAIIDTDDQYEVFNNPNASDPSHSLLSKDHFALILNEPAGKIALVVVRHSVDLIVRAWYEESNPDQVIDQILEAFHHPYYATGRSQIQNDMFQEMRRWVDGLEDQRTTLSQLTKESVRAGGNKRQGSDDDMSQSNQVYGGSASTGGYNKPQRPSYGGAQPSAGYGGGYGGGSAQSHGQQGRHGSENTYSSGTHSSSQQGYGQTQSTYGSSQSTYGSSEGGYGRTQGYGSAENDYSSQTQSYRPPQGAPPGRYQSEQPSQSTYGRTEYSSGHQTSGHGYSRDNDDSESRSYGNTHSAGRRQGEADSFYNPDSVQESFGRMSVNENTGYGRGNQGYSNTGDAYSSSRRGDEYSSSRRDDDDHPSRKHNEYSSGRTEGYGASSTYGSGHGSSGYGGSGGYGSTGGVSGGYGGGGEISGGYGGRSEEGRRRGDDDDSDEEKKRKKEKQKYGRDSSEERKNPREQRKEYHEERREEHHERREEFREHRHEEHERRHRRKDSD